MGILDQYKEAVKSEKNFENMDFPSNSNLSETDREAYEAELNKLRGRTFSDDEIKDAINNSRNNLNILGESHDGGSYEIAYVQQPLKITDGELVEKGLLSDGEISDIKVIRAYCPKCGKELIAKAPPMFNPFTMEKLCLHECCDTKYNLDNTYPRIVFYDEEGNEIKAFF